MNDDEIYDSFKECLKTIGYSKEKINATIMDWKMRDVEAKKYQESKQLYFEEIIPKYIKCLNSAKKEEDVQSFLARNVQLAMEAFCDGARPLDIIPKFKLGQDYVTDFTLLGVRSYGDPYHVVLVELESPNANPYNKIGTYSKILNMAVKQVTDWQNWLKQKNETFCADFPEKLTRYNDPDLRDRIRKAMITYKIVIGRRKDFTEKDRESRGAFFDLNNGRIEIFSYDNIADFGRRYLEYPIR